MYVCAFCWLDPNDVAFFICVEVNRKLECAVKLVVIPWRKQSMEVSSPLCVSKLDGFQEVEGLDEYLSLCLVKK